MANEQLYDKYADIPALEEQTEKILRMFANVESGLARLSKGGLNISTAGSVAEVGKLSKEYDALSKELLTQQKHIASLTAKLAVANNEEAKHAEGLKQVIALTKGLTAEEIKRQKIQQGEYEQLQLAKKANKELADSIQLRIKIRTAEAGSIEQLQLRYQKLNGIITKLSADQRNSARGQQLTTAAKAMSDQINTLKKGAGDFSKNVGRYAESLGGLFDSVRNEISKLQQKQQQLQQQQKANPIGFTVGGGDVELRKTTAALDELTGVLAIGNKEGQTFYKTTAQLEKAFGTLSETGNQSRTFIQGFKVEVAQAKDKTQDLKDEIKALSSDTRQLDLAVGTVHAMSSAFEAAAGTAALLGNNTGDIQKITQKLIAIQSIANGVREIGEQVTKRGTAANKAYNFVLQQGTVLFGKGSTAAQRFNAALKGIVILAVIAGIYQLVKSMDIFGKSAEERREEVDQLNQSMQELYDTTKTLNELTAKNPTDNLGIEVLKQQLALQQANGASLASQFKTKQQIAQKERDLAEKQIQDLIARGDAFDETVTGEMDGYDQIEKAQQDFFDKTVEGNRELRNLQRQRVNNAKTMTEAEKTILDNSIKDQQAYVNSVKSQYDEYTAVITNAIQTQQNLDTLRAEEATRQREAEKKAALDLLKFRKQLVIEQKTFEASDDGIGSARAKVKAAQDVADAEKAILNKQREFDLSQKDLAASQKRLIEEKYSEDIYNINLKLSKDIIRIYTKEKDDRIRLAKESSDEFDKVQQANFEDSTSKLEVELAKALAVQEKYYGEDLKANDERFLNKEISAEQHAKRKEEIELSYQKAVISAEIIFYEQQLRLLQALGKDTTEIAAKIALAKSQLSGFDVSTAEKTAEEIKALNAEIAQNYYDTFQSIAQSFNNILGGIAEARKQQIQDQIDDIERLKAAEIDRVSKSGDSEEKKAARIKIIEAKAQTEREALERRQRQIDRQRAIAERSFKAFQINTDTITAVNKIRLLIAAAPDPITKTLYTSQLILAIASGAASLTAILAAPLPKFGKGGTVKEDGPIIIAEKGREFEDKPSGERILHEHPKIIWAKKGTKIHANDVTEQMIEASGKERLSIMNNRMVISSNDSRLLDETIKSNKLLKEIISKSGITIMLNQPIEVSAWYDQQMKH